MGDSRTARRKDEHLDLCATEDVAPKENRSLLDDVRLLHCAMPEMNAADVDLTMSWFGKTLKAPLMITGMTGGTERSGRVNSELAEVAEEFGLAFGLGSQRAMLEDDSLTSTYLVRRAAPNTVVIGNIGLAQAVGLGTDRVQWIMDAIAADGLAVHLNPGQELTQPEGDRDFTGGFATMRRLARVLGERLVVKETGCGIGPEVARMLAECGVRTIDVSGLGGTSWIRVEKFRASGAARELGEQFSSWGIPTAAAVALARNAVGSGVRIIASGGVRTGLDIARAMALGADLAGMALPIYMSYRERGQEGARHAISGILRALTHAFVLTGCRRVSELRERPRVILGELRSWLDGSIASSSAQQIRPE
jgi:isopentenyl-diphosphate delta-isomerase